MRTLLTQPRRGASTPLSYPDHSLRPLRLLCAVFKLRHPPQANLPQAKRTTKISHYETNPILRSTKAHLIPTKTPRTPPRPFRAHPCFPWSKNPPITDQAKRITKRTQSAKRYPHTIPYSLCVLGVLCGALLSYETKPFRRMAFPGRSVINQSRGGRHITYSKSPDGIPEGIWWWVCVVGRPGWLRGWRGPPPVW